MRGGLKVDPALLRQRRRDRARALQLLGPARDGRKVAFYAREGGFGVDVADDREGRVVGDVVGLKEPLHVLEADRLHVVRIVAEQVIGMRFGIERSLKRFGEPARRAPRDLLAKFLEHDALLTLDLLGVDGAHQERHPVGFDPSARSSARGGIST